MKNSKDSEPFISKKAKRDTSFQLHIQRHATLVIHRLTPLPACSACLNPTITIALLHNIMHKPTPEKPDTTHDFSLANSWPT